MTTIEINECEERLKQAMLHADVAMLDKLISPQLLFTNHLGRLMSKQDDLDAYQSGLLTITDIQLFDQKIKMYGHVAVVNVQAKIIGRYADVESETIFRFTRVWSQQPDDAGWQIIAAHSSEVDCKN